MKLSCDKSIYKEVNKKTFFLLNRKKTNPIIMTVIILVTVGLFFLFLFNNSYRFITIDEILNQTLLRVLVSMFAGFALSVAGAAMQGITRNVLAGPTTLGLLPATTLGSILFQLINIKGTYLLFILSIIFSFVVVIVNFLTLQIKSKDTNNFKSILVGLILGAGLSSINIIIISTNANINEQIISWLGSTTQGFTWDRFIYAGPLIIIGTIIIMFSSKRLNIIEESPILAKTLGINISRTYWLIGSSVILITCSSVLLIGGVVIIGIVMPHLCRFIFRTRNYKIITPMSGFLTSIIIMFAMWINIRYSVGLNLFAVICSVPMFLYFIIRKK